MSSNNPGNYERAQRNGHEPLLFLYRSLHNGDSDFLNSLRGWIGEVASAQTQRELRNESQCAHNVWTEWAPDLCRRRVKTLPSLHREVTAAALTR